MILFSIYSSTAIHYFTHQTHSQMSHSISVGWLFSHQYMYVRLVVKIRQTTFHSKAVFSCSWLLLLLFSNGIAYAFSVAMAAAMDWMETYIMVLTSALPVMCFNGSMYVGDFTFVVPGSVMSVPALWSTNIVVCTLSELTDCINWLHIVVAILWLKLIHGSCKNSILPYQ